jgi:AcrR family transcriptional regulator
MRAVAAELQVEAMSLYHHVTGKSDLVDGMVDVVFGEFRVPLAGAPWRREMELRCRSARQVLRVHGWAVGLLDSRTEPGPATLAHHDAVLGCLRADGFSVAEAGHAIAVLDAFTYGFAVQEANLPIGHRRGRARTAPRGTARPR